MIGLFLAAVLAAAFAAAGPVESGEALASQRLAAHVQETLDGMLGPGRAKVQAEVRGGGSQTRTESEIVSPLDKNSAAGQAAARRLDLPGYNFRREPGQETEKGVSNPASTTFVQRDYEQSLRESGFEIRQIQATVVLDAALGDGPVREVSQLLPQLLRIDASRGDVLTILRAPLRPAWRSAFSTASDWRAASFAAAAFFAALLAALILGAALVRGARTLGSELAFRRGASLEPLPSAGGGMPLPELVAGGPPGGFLGAGVPGGAAALPLLLGQRFDFLQSREPSLVSRALAGETSEALCLVFGHLASSAPDLASRLFANLSPAVQAEVSQSLVKLSVADPERLDAIEARLRRAVENGVEGPQSLARILSRVPGEARADVFARLAETDARAGEEVQRHIFAFEDLGSLSAVELRRLLAAVPYEAWGPALRGAPQGVLDRVLADLPEGPRASVRDAASAPQSREKVASARSLILDALAALAAKGEVSLGGSEAEGGFV